MGNNGGQDQSSLTGVQKIGKKNKNVIYQLIDVMAASVFPGFLPLFPSGKPVSHSTFGDNKPFSIRATEAK